jgi:hypothetical protein
LVSPDKNEKIGTIVKLFTSEMQEHYTKADNFSLDSKKLILIRNSGVDHQLFTFFSADEFTFN